MALQHLIVEWDVDKTAHDAELAMSFEIQVHRADEATVWTVSVLFIYLFIQDILDLCITKETKGKSYAQVHIQISASGL